jgi:hypothetical protein
MVAARHGVGGDLTAKPDRTVPYAGKQIQAKF